ncbi:protein of unknown function (plasmid) [Cupriavidus taiwanensis]|uniref:Transglutaminase-like domain-containing protein n=1 Tax=Cupriavidus taiwanensis TaxID=164546 RepID=A0A375FFM9_9BURK|nr:transglutaminase-like domain-containing protein [Cupriavidus taiwanensis]SOZ71163.1 protein of unknown function [Cupriavidus taiwanensis]SOZ72239.1 protein of unknown function [Cupriavidus taiwanensis]SOZ74546.1 protein of unknown function [Cupriavidus taiwanensis]SPA03471.1 protein of unknown function [Cupriavidus taiwanensis]SPA12755.1 hypothetical protein CBM2625_U40017 [Cupriavidus taiwanensis]
MNFSHIYHLFARYPVLANDRSFLDWLKIHGASSWRETEIDTNDQRDVIVISHDELTAYAARIKFKLLADDSSETCTADQSIISVREFDLLRSNSKHSLLRAAIQSNKINRCEITSISPYVNFDGDDYTDITWKIEFVRNGLKYILSISEAGAEEAAHGEVEVQAKSSEPIAIFNEWLATNEVHSPYLFKQQAEAWTSGPLTVREKAFRIFSNVQRLYRYDSTIRNITEFTLRDTLTRDANNYRGICDEWAVVQISYLRAIGIESRLKFLIWTQGGRVVGHACLEFNNGGKWTHMDALWNAFDNAARYRSSGAQQLTVMDADYPMDSRSNSPAWGVPDPRGDGKLNPYADFVISPPYPGNRRPGYSY